MKVLALVPARNEAARVGATVVALSHFVEEVLVIDDGSRDATGEVAALAGARVVRIEKGRGKGQAIERGIRSVGSAPDVWLLADADLGETARLLVPLLDAVGDGRADLAIAVLPRQGGGFGVVKRLAAMAIERLSGFQTQEPLSGQRVMKAEVLSGCRPMAGGFGVETAMTIDAARLGYRIVEMPTDIRHRPTGRDIGGFTHRGRQGWDILRAVAARASGLR